jgi:hypothetical protein
MEYVKTAIRNNNLSEFSRNEKDESEQNVISPGCE